MSRFLFAPVLYLFASVAMAGTPVAIDDAVAGSAKPGKAGTVANAQEIYSVAGGHPAAAPVRTTAPRGVSPRWHSLLPGMIR